MLRELARDRSNLLTVRHRLGSNFSSAASWGTYCARPPALFCIGINVLPGRSHRATPTTDPFNTPACSIHSLLCLLLCVMQGVLYRAAAAKQNTYCVCINFYCISKKCVRQYEIKSVFELCACFIICRAPISSKNSKWALKIMGTLLNSYLKVLSSEIVHSKGLY